MKRFIGNPLLTAKQSNASLKNLKTLAVLGVVGAVLTGSPAFAQFGTSPNMVSESQHITELTEGQTIQAYRTSSPSVVTIHAGNGAGTGIVVDSTCLVLTNQHVLGTPDNIDLSLSGTEKFKGKLIATSKNPADDLALIQVVGKNAQCSALRLGDSSRVQVGQQVLAIGNPFGLEKTLTKGIISRIDEQKNRLQTDAAINPGNSGGPLLNANGEMIGMNQAIINPAGRSSAGIALAIPVNVVKDFLAAYRSNDAQQISKVITRSPQFFESQMDSQLNPVYPKYRKKRTSAGVSDAGTDAPGTTNITEFSTSGTAPFWQAVSMLGVFHLKNDPIAWMNSMVLKGWLQLFNSNA